MTGRSIDVECTTQELFDASDTGEGSPVALILVGYMTLCQYREERGRGC
jgi:hypothetical protein